MKYSQGNLGRVLVIKLEHGDNLIEELKGVCAKENICEAVLFVVGALQKASLVVGPKEAVVPPEPVWKQFEDGREIVGIGTVFDSDSGPAIHLHASIGRGDKVMTGCIRKDTEVYLVVEVILLEIIGSGTKRVLDQSLGLHLIDFERR